MALGGGEGLEFGHFRQSFILKGCDHLAQQRAARYPGCMSGVGINPERGCIGLFLHGRQSHFGGEDRMHENPGQRLRYDGENAQRRGEAATLSGLGKCGDTDPG